MLCLRVSECRPARAQKYFMTFISDDRPLSDVNNAAVRAEIGERLRISLRQRLVEMPSNLLLLVERLRRRSQAEKHLSP